MGGLSSNDQMDKVLVLAATNIPWVLDSAIRRRLERRIYIPMPDLETRTKMLQIYLKGIKCALNEADIDELARITDRFSGSDITIAIQDALFEPIRKVCSAAIVL